MKKEEKMRKLGTLFIGVVLSTFMTPVFGAQACPDGESVLGAYTGKACNMKNGKCTLKSSPVKIGKNPKPWFFNPEEHIYKEHSQNSFTVNISPQGQDMGNKCNYTITYTNIFNKAVFRRNIEISQTAYPKSQGAFRKGATMGAGVAGAIVGGTVGAAGGAFKQGVGQAKERSREAWRQNKEARQKSTGISRGVRTGMDAGYSAAAGIGGAAGGATYGPLKGAGKGAKKGYKMGSSLITNEKKKKVQGQ